MNRKCFLLICAFLLTAGFFVVSPTTAETLLYSDTFESGLGNWSNTGSGDTNDWTLNSGRTPSFWTGPSGGADSTYYMYMETSPGYANTEGDSAILLGPSITGSDIRVIFNYHMYGVKMGTLSLDVLSEGSWINNVWSLSGPQQKRAYASYIQTDVDLSAYSVSQVRFRGTAAGGFTGDMAIDTIEIWGTSLSELDTDNDGVTDDLDLCPGTPAGETVDSNGCDDSEKDTDGDGVNDLLDHCPTDVNKTELGECGCGIFDRDYNNDGIFECAEGDIFVVSSIGDDLTTGSLRKAIIDANATDAADMIILQHDETYTLSLSGADEDASATGDLDIKGDVEIVGNNAVIDAAGIDRVLHILPGAHVTIRDFTIKGGQTVNGHGGGIYVDSGATLIMENCVVTENATGSYKNTSGEVISGADGGGIYVYVGGELNLKSCTISYNKTGSGGLRGGSGGGIYAYSDYYSYYYLDLFKTSVDLESCLITHNTTGDGNSQNDGNGYGGSGGGLSLRFCDTRLNKCIISNNTTGSGYSSTDDSSDAGYGGTGGGVYLVYGNAVLDMCTIQSNVTGRGNNGGNSGSGGGISAGTTETLTIENSTISGNRTGTSDYYSGHGGGIFTTNPDMIINNSTITGNATGDGAFAGNGAGIYSTADLKINNTTITLNSGGSSSALDNIDSCSDAYGGGGLYNEAGMVEFKNSIVAGNTVEFDNCGQDGRTGEEGSVTSYGYNIIGNDAAWSFSSHATDIIGTSTSQVDPDWLRWVTTVGKPKPMH